MPVLKIQDIDIDFPFEPYDVQVAYMTKVIEALQTKDNAILESPTGTGKTLCLLCATLAWHKAEVLKLSELAHQAELQNHNALPEGLGAWASDGKEKISTVPKIIYASRTHSQLTQVVNELKRTVYGKNTVISVLGSREQVCVHHEVSQQSNNQTMVHMCRNKVNKRMCLYYNNVESAVKNGVFTNTVMDIEDLVTVGKQRAACPYYAARETSKRSDCAIIFTPYNYLLDKRSRHSQNLDVAGNILIFDEAHNLEKHCEESASFDVTSLDFAHCVDEVGDVLNAATKMSESGVIAEGHEAGASSTLTEFNLEELALLKNFFIRLEEELDAIELPASKQKAEKGEFIFEYFSKVNLTFQTCDVLIDLMERVFSYLSTLSNSYRTRGTALQKFAEIIKIVFNPALNAGKFSLLGLDTNVLRNEMARHYRVHISEDKEPPKRQDNLLKQKQTKPSRTLSYWCFSPGYAMRELVGSGVRTMILTSGTLTPIQSFVAELQIAFPIQLENGHVIEDYQVFVASMMVGVGGKKLEADYKSRSDENKVAELGRTVLEILRLSPGGALVFFPSYSAMNQYFTMWQANSNLMEMFEFLKPCTIEPRNKAEMKQAMEKYYDDVKGDKGGALFAVCRGKISEGLDFSDDNGRTVVIIGIPFPPIMDPKVKLKKAFLDDQRRNAPANVLAIPGEHWYRQQACRAVNQAIGRVIRHRYDYGAIVLCDHRFSRIEQREQLPAWVQSRVNEFDDGPRFLRRLKSFFCSAREKEKLQRNPNKKPQIKKVIPTAKVESCQPSTSKQLSFSTTQEQIKKLPKGNQVDIHVPSKKNTWAEQMKFDGACKSTASQSKSIPRLGLEDFTSILRNKRIQKEKNKPKVGLLDALDGAVEDEASSEKDEIEVQSSCCEDQKQQPGAKRRKIIVKPSSSSTRKPNHSAEISKSAAHSDKNSKSTVSTTESNQSNQAESKKIVSSSELYRMSKESYLLVIRRTLSAENYSKFKKLILLYQEHHDMDVLFNGLIQFLLVDEQSRQILKSFHRFLIMTDQPRFVHLVNERLS